MVVKGDISPESLGLNQLETIALRNELRLAEVRIETQKELIDSKNIQLDQLMEYVGESIRAASKSQVHVQVSPSIEFSPVQSVSTKNALNSSDSSSFIEAIEELEKRYHSADIQAVLEAVKLQVECNDTENLRRCLLELDKEDKTTKTFFLTLFRLENN